MPASEQRLIRLGEDERAQLGEMLDAGDIYLTGSERDLLTDLVTRFDEDGITEEEADELAGLVFGSWDKALTATETRALDKLRSLSQSKTPESEG